MTAPKQSGRKTKSQTSLQLRAASEPQRERLGTPIHLSEPSSVLPPSPPTISPQRCPNSSILSLSRRHPSRECHVDARQPHSFDSLTWTASLETSPYITNPWDIADLSLLPVRPLSELPDSGLGPLRRRKRTLRYSPLASNSLNLKSTSYLPNIRDNSRSLHPSTPRSRFTPSRVLFQNLMPVVCD